MAPNQNTLIIDDNSSEQALALAAEALDRCQAVVVVDGVVALRSMPDVILCEVKDPMPNAHRCEEEFKVLVENASRDLANSKFAGRLPDRPLQWRVVEDSGFGTEVLWRGP